MPRVSGCLISLAFILFAATATAHREGGELPAPRDVARLEIDAAEEAVPWTHLDFGNDAENFQFLAVSDKTGGNRKGVFPDALRKARLLQPEFIISVGDLIQGYTEDVAEIGRQWNEFEGLLEGFEIPFFYVPGNHDVSNPVMAGIWLERFGRNYYHFRYRDVLFLCLDSEDGKRAHIGEKQVAYFEKALADNPDVRWTLLFVHRPLWLQNEIDPGWLAVESAIEDRAYTVLAGHVHRYTKYVRKDRRYIVLATTGGGSDLRGPDMGEFDQVAWVTMTDKGPLLANLLLDGIWDEDIYTERTKALSAALDNIVATPLLFGPRGELVAEPGIRIINDETIPMRIQVSAEPHPLLSADWSVTDSVPPSSVLDISLPVEIESGNPARDYADLSLEIQSGFTPDDHRPLDRANRISLAMETLRSIQKAPTGIEIDGDLNEWGELPYRTGAEGEQGTATFNICRDAETLYFAARVRDNNVISPDPPARRWQHDYIELRIDPRPFEKRIQLERQWDNRIAFYLPCFPASESGEMQVPRRDDYPEGLHGVQTPVAEGYAVEVAIPLDHLRERGGADVLRGFSLNVTVIDRDDPNKRGRSSSWRPAWHRDEHVVGGGSFGLE